MQIGDRVSFMSHAAPQLHRVVGVIEYQDDNPSNFVVITEHGVRHSVPKGWLDPITE